MCLPEPVSGKNAWKPLSVVDGELSCKRPSGYKRRAGRSGSVHADYKSSILHSVHAPGCTIPLRTVIRDQKSWARKRIRQALPI